MSKTWTIIADSEAAALRDKVAKHYPLVSPHKITRLCMKYGLRCAVKNPKLLLKEAKHKGEPERLERDERVSSRREGAKTQRIEFRVDSQFRQQLDDLASDMHCGVSEVIRRLIELEYTNRFD
jgi:hypothetical protein